MTSKIKQMIANARQISIGADIWTKRGLTMSYLGVSAAFYDPIGKQPVHAFLNLHIIEHPHTGDAMAAKLQRTIT